MNPTEKPPRSRMAIESDGALEIRAAVDEIFRKKAEDEAKAAKKAKTPPHEHATRHERSRIQGKGTSNSGRLESRANAKPGSDSTTTSASPYREFVENVVNDLVSCDGLLRGAITLLDNVDWGRNSSSDASLTLLDDLQKKLKGATDRLDASTSQYALPTQSGGVVS